MGIKLSIFTFLNFDVHNDIDITSEHYHSLMHSLSFFNIFNLAFEIYNTNVSYLGYCYHTYYTISGVLFMYSIYTSKFSPRMRLISPK